MKILSVRHALPSRKVTNDDVLDEFRRASDRTLDKESVAVLDRQIRRYLRAAGTTVRYVLAPDEKAIDIASRAARSACDAAGVTGRDVDFLIFAGVSRGWLDPSMANVFAHELALTNATCFDVLDGCASWLRAMHVAHAYMSGGIYRCGMILNCECSLGRYADFAFTGPDDLAHRFAMFTIGEAATATLVAPDEHGDYYSTFRNFGEYHDLALLGLENIDSFLPEASHRPSAPLKFFALSSELIPTASEKAVELFHADRELSSRTFDLCFTHAASERASMQGLERMGIPRDRHVSTHPSYGNTVSASIPLGLSVAIQDERLTRGKRVLAIAGSAGITVGFAAFTF
jgi:3-oxoacyl-[acyl-carrier-protein] synthase III